MVAKLNFKAIKKYHISTFTTNLLALVLAIFFIRSYRLKGISLLPAFIIVLTILVIFVLAGIFILKSLGRAKRILPGKKFIFLNMLIAVIFGLVFLKDIGLLGFCFTLLFAFFLFEMEHILYEGLGR